MSSRVFNWEYFSFLTLDDSMSSKLLLLVPGCVLALSLVWMNLVKWESDKKSEGITFEEACADAMANEVDSGTEMDDSQLSEKPDDTQEEKTEDKTGEKTEDEESELVDEELEVVEKEELDKKED